MNGPSEIVPLPPGGTIKYAPGQADGVPRAVGPSVCENVGVRVAGAGVGAGVNRTTGASVRGSDVGDSVGVADGARLGTPVV